MTNQELEEKLRQPGLREEDRWFWRFHHVRCAEGQLQLRLEALERENAQLQAALAAIRNTTDQGKA